MQSPCSCDAAPWDTANCGRPRWMAGARRQVRGGLTLVELIVVMVIIGLLVGLTLPAVQWSRERVRRETCRSNMRQVGLAFEMYLNNHEKFPDAAVLPSLSPLRPSLREALGQYIESSKGTFRCPSDNKYYEVEGTSYEYPALFLANRRREEVLNGRASATVFVYFDLDPWHGPIFSGRSRNYLYMDWHVDW